MFGGSTHAQSYVSAKKYAQNEKKGNIFFILVFGFLAFPAHMYFMMLYLKALKASMKPFETPQRSVKNKNLIFSLRPGSERERLKDFITVYKYVRENVHTGFYYLNEI